MLTSLRASSANQRPEKQVGHCPIIVQGNMYATATWGFTHQAKEPVWSIALRRAVLYYIYRYVMNIELNDPKYASLNECYQNGLQCVVRKTYILPANFKLLEDILSVAALYSCCYRLHSSESYRPATKIRAIGQQATME